VHAFSVFYSDFAAKSTFLPDVAFVRHNSPQNWNQAYKLQAPYTT